ncbi:hypothetical protein AKJ09_04182 [Labilithrix luteola]|uniref:DUF4920 domain-containing protein n=1 Tax=Labilithrix luteola TaxID=1391654 RepID=A0A0K1PVF9_9BACT|nr:DUF4920 domain-containing protein [Labilithrix luteola]AKU97518.1 hypothetical protein AKJ09_04182 [Labilithrix luteola]
MRLSLVAALAFATLASACKQNAPPPSESTPPTAAPSSAAAAKPASSADGVVRLGTTIESSAQKVALADVAKDPQAFTGKTFATTGTVTAVCQHMGCWMEIKDDASEAHIKMAGHAFFVPKTASGRKARILATLEKAGAGSACADEEEPKAGAAPAPADKKGKSGCRAEAEAQMGHPLAKLELVAQGVELL